MSPLLIGQASMSVPADVRADSPTFLSFDRSMRYVTIAGNAGGFAVFLAFVRFLTYLSLLKQYGACVGVAARRDGAGPLTVCVHCRCDV